MKKPKVHLTLTMVQKKVAKIAKIANQDGDAHSAEDALYIMVLEAIAGKSCDDPVELATEALKTLKIDFQRWCT